MNPLLLIPAVVIFLLLVQIIIKLYPREIIKRRPSLPGAGWKIIYTDNAPAGEERKPGIDYGKPLADTRMGLSGKPDYIYSNGRGLIPVELKSAKISDSPVPRPGDLMQLAVYFYLAEVEYGLRARKGLLIYGDAMFAVKNTRRLRGELAEKIREMRETLEDSSVMPEDEASFAKCRYCVCRGTVCEINGGNRFDK